MVHRGSLGHQENLCTLGKEVTSLGVKSFLFTRDGCHYITLASQTASMLVEKPDLTFHFMELQNAICLIVLLLCSLGKEASLLLALNSCHIIQVLDNVLWEKQPTIHPSSIPALDL